MPPRPPPRPVFRLPPARPTGRPAPRRRRVPVGAIVPPEGGFGVPAPEPPRRHRWVPWVLAVPVVLLTTCAAPLALVFARVFAPSPLLRRVLPALAGGLLATVVIAAGVLILARALTRRDRW
jgi:hypothetical protein